MPAKEVKEGVRKVLRNVAAYPESGAALAAAAKADVRVICCDVLPDELSIADIVIEC